MPALRALIVDDEPLARRHLRTLLASDPDVEIVGECGNGLDAVSAIQSGAPDLVFLDVQMPELDGFGVVRALDPHHMPVLIFITAHDEYALNAFRVHALDYLLKPVDRSHFHETLARAKALVRSGHGHEDGDQLLALLERLAARQQQVERLAVKVQGKIIFLRVHEIDWIEALDNHVRIHTGSQVHLVRDTMTRLETRLPAAKFLRIHRSTIVNTGRIKELQPWFQGDYVVILADGTQLTSSRSYRANLQRFLRRTT